MHQLDAFIYQVRTTIGQQSFAFFRPTVGLYLTVHHHLPCSITACHWMCSGGCWKLTVFLRFLHRAVEMGS